MKLKTVIKKKFLNPDGTINKTVVASFITLLIVLIQQVMMAFGFTYGHWDQVAAIINTLLTILGLCGFVEGNGEVTTSTVETGVDGVKTTISNSSIKLNTDKTIFSGKSFIPNQSNKEDNPNEK
ncbi:hypothetical protein [Limosilactobacillus reuteri]|uniref:Holin n=2 Tax=Limosilactobacillus reuteri TaxID=1598 RepID=A5VKH8_LIMRD|nr:hypothetical protein [Limosilactobacillus reuteri]AYN56750.1 holin [Lactobacillus phage LR2]ABQ83352.1 hypothetical protein Lreu_1095 [Limosilactobacillus reuteri subsp. reuteri]EEI08307.1 hypothetical protein HMPREF0535_1916 [Limosilactobacillus reuteri MM2-3]EGC15903.1 hypothetical protein HMPREF0536_10082 [Limosilactobacillus reuteri MM4-1A]EGC16031.1 hypothetical protein HMPREF0536_10059 [Limosilactobacillus reuteri MM4-1A]